MPLVLPIESNPETMNKYLKKLGVSEKWRMVDVISLDDEILKALPRPVLAVLLLFPVSAAYERHRTAEENELKLKGLQPPAGVFHLRQVVSNACGTIALVHSIANNTNNIDVEDGLLKNYLTVAQNLDAEAKGALLEQSTAILDAYREIERPGENANAIIDEPVNNHFVTFIHKDGILFELDGRKEAAISHGATTPETLLEDAAKVCREFIARDPDNLSFNVMALVGDLSKIKS